MEHKNKNMPQQYLDHEDRIDFRTGQNPLGGRKSC